MQVDITKKNENKYLIFHDSVKKLQVLENYKKLWEETKKQTEVINDDEPIE